MRIIKIFLFMIMVPVAIFGDDVLVVVNGKEITIDDANFFVANTLVNTTYEELNIEQKEMVKNRLIEKALFAQEAIKDGTEKNIEYQINIKRLKEDLLVNTWIKEQLENTVVSDSEAHDFYRANQSRFTEPTLMRVWHIVVANKQDANAIISALSPLEGDILEGAFMSLAQEKSTAKTAKNGGDMGFVQTNQMDSKMFQLLKNLNNKSIAKEPFHGEDGYHVLYLEDTNLPKVLPYESVKDSILLSLKHKQLSSHLVDVAKELKSKAEIIVPNPTNGVDN